MLSDGEVSEKNFLMKEAFEYAPKSGQQKGK